MNQTSFLNVISKFEFFSCVRTIKSHIIMSKCFKLYNEMQFDINSQGLF